MWNPINRTTVQTEENKYRLYANSGPINYKKPESSVANIFLALEKKKDDININELNFKEKIWQIKHL